MSLFIASLSFDGALLDVGRAGILPDSAASILVGMAVLAVSLPRKAVE
ncbi:MAG: hypothetical protein R3F34_01725 [Planctomycetota bacterium]